MADAGEVAAEAAGEQQNTLPPGITMQMQGIAPPKPLDLSSASTIDNWKTWKQMWENYSIVAGINRQPEHFKIALFLHSIGPDALKVYNTFVYTEAENRDDIKIIIKNLMISSLVNPMKSTRDTCSTRDRRNQQNPLRTTQLCYVPWRNLVIFATAYTIN